MNRLTLIFVGLLSTLNVFAYQIQSVKVVGDKNAEVQFTGNGQLPVPTYKVVEGALELSFPGGEISESAQGKLDLESPHALIRRISVYSPEKDLVRARIVVNGTNEDLKRRFSMSRIENGVSAVVEFPQGESATLNLLKEEQLPVPGLAKEIKKEGGKIPYLQVVLAFVLLGAAAVTTYFFVKALKSKTGIRGTRRYLIEQLGYVSLGNKTGVSLLKVGREFILVGVTPNQVSLLSALPKLQEQYDEESHFERGVFQEAISEEVSRLKTANV